MPRRSRVGNRISTWWISRYAGVRYTDTQSGFRVYPRAIFDVPLQSTKFDTETELLLRAARMKLPLVEVPIKTIYAADHASHFHGFSDTLRVIKLVFFSPLWLLALLLSAACAHAPPHRVTAELLPASDAWHTMRAEHRVTVDCWRADSGRCAGSSPWSGRIAFGCARSDRAGSPCSTWSRWPARCA